MESAIGTNNKILELEHVTKNYQMGEVCVADLDPISFRIIPGEFFIALGISGSDASSLLNLSGTPFNSQRRYQHDIVYTIRRGS